jgi:hypothetical protein
MWEESMTWVVLRLNKPKVICEIFEDEVVAINLETGTYFGMAGTAKEVWRLIEGEVPVEGMVAHLAERYGKPRPEVAADLELFTNGLMANGLVAAQATDGSVPAIGIEGPAGSWEAPELTVYDDMKDLLLLDPIHDVDESGWPARQQDATP